MSDTQNYPKITKHFSKKTWLVHFPMLDEQNILHTTMKACWKLGRNQKGGLPSHFCIAK
jgi:hypothetical protein